MKTVVRHIINRIFIVLLVIQTLNLSINSIDFYRVDTARGAFDQTDYVDSMVEYMIENVLNFSKHTFNTKTTTTNTSKQQAAAHVVLKWFPTYTVIFNQPAGTSQSNKISPRNEVLVNFYYREVPVKPPQI